MRSHHHRHTDGKVLYRNAFATTLPLDDRTVAAVVEAGLSRWKIENENNNTLKINGYHFEHNYGHGQHHLLSLLASLIILAFLVHTTLECMDGKYPLLRQKLPSRKRLFNDIRTLTSYLVLRPLGSVDGFHAAKLRAGPPRKTG